jgi:nucleotide-binding universal stress UspA family protein
MTATRILLAVDDSFASQRAAKECLAFARLLNATVYLLHVVPTVLDGMFEQPVAPENLVVEANELIDALAKRGREAGVTVEKLRPCIGMQDEAIVGIAKDKDMHMIFMGTHGRQGIERLVCC